MDENQHLLEVYEPYEYEGPNPISVSGSGILRGPNGAFYYIVSVASPFHVDRSRVEQLLVLPRYNGDKIQRAKQSTCTVNIATVRPGVKLEHMGPLSYADICHWGVGKISQASPPPQ
jgi:hypothetical protein